MISGKMRCLLFNNSGDIKKKCTLNKGDIFRVPINTFHTMIPLTKFCIYHESKIGPFLKKQIVFFRNGSKNTVRTLFLKNNTKKNID